MRRALLASLLPILLPVLAPAQTNTPSVYILPIQGVINPSLVYTVRRGIQEARKQGADAIVLDMHTPGGSVEATRQIMRALLDVPSTIRTVTFVNTWALSAGSFISLSTDDIYMAPQSVIGAAAPVAGSPLGGASEMPDTMEEKAVSAISAMVRAAAQTKGHDQRLAEAMVRKDIEYAIGEETISRKGELLTLTNVEAERLVDDPPRALLSRGTVKDMDDLLATLGRGSHRRVHLEVTRAERVARWVQMLPVLFLTGGLLGLYIEFRTPGFGLPGILGGLLLAIWFWANHVAGLAGGGELLAFLIGLGFLAVEFFVLPGFGFVGLAGIVIMIAALLMAMVPYVPSESTWAPALPHLADFTNPLLTLSYSLLGFCVGVIVSAYYLPRTQAFRRIALLATTDRAHGYSASEEHVELLGQTGEALTPMRPSGTARIGGQRWSVVSRGEFIEAGDTITVVEVRGNRVVVARGGSSESTTAG